MTNEQRKNILLSAGSGAAGALLVLAMVGFVFFGKHSALAQNILSSLYSSTTSTTSQSEADSRAQLASGNMSIPDVVKKSSPAVVSITLKQTVPVYADGSTQPPIQDPFQQFQQFFGGPFGGMSPQRTPPQKPTGQKQIDIGGGSGFLVSDDGYIVTNKHVVSDDGVSYVVTLNDGSTHDAKVIARDPSYDIAVIKIEGKGFPHLSFGDSNDIQVGQTAIAIGNALAEFKNTVSVGVISGLSRSIDAEDDMGGGEHLNNLIQTDAAINPGNSGGPLLNMNGDVIGMNTAMASAENIGFALPANTVKLVADAVRTTGKISRPFLGVRYLPITADMQKQDHLSVDYGVIVARGETMTDIAVLPGSPADKAGIVENDIILSVDGQKIDETHDLASLIREHKTGDAVTLHILHKGKEQDVKVTLEEAK